MQSTAEVSQQSAEVGEQDVRERWKEFKEILEVNKSKLVDKMMNHNLAALRRKFLKEMRLEFEFCYTYNEMVSYTERQRLEDFWTCVIYRPDICCEMVKYMRSKDLDLHDVAKILEQAIKAAKWQEDNWFMEDASGLSPAHTTESTPLGAKWYRALTQSGDAAVGVATIADAELQRSGLISEETLKKLREFPKFDIERGKILVKSLRRQHQDKVWKFFEARKNNFVLGAFHLALHDKWPGPQIESALPSLPSYYVLRKELMDDLNATVKEKFNGNEQHWITIHGQMAVGKTVMATAVALTVGMNGKVPLWIRCGDRKDTKIWSKAAKTIAFELDLTNSGDSESFLKKNLTKENSEQLVLFLDDVMSPDVLRPFSEARYVILTSREKIEYHRIQEENLSLFEIPMSLSMNEAMELIDNTVKKEITIGREHLENILLDVKYNALTVSCIGLHLERKREKEDFQEEKFLRELNVFNEFTLIANYLEPTGHHYIDESRKKEKGFEKLMKAFRSLFPDKFCDP